MSITINNRNDKISLTTLSQWRGLVEKLRPKELRWMLVFNGQPDRDHLYQTKEEAVQAKIGCRGLVEVYEETVELTIGYSFYGSWDWKLDGRTDHDFNVTVFVTHKSSADQIVEEIRQEIEVLMGMKY